MDMGISKSLAEDCSLTLTGQFVGTPHYIVHGDYPEPILTLAEAVGPWRFQLIHAPGNPAPAQPSEMTARTPAAVTPSISSRIVASGAGSGMLPKPM